ncbi:helix-turn-helix transcriptional regulator [Ornithinibacillus halophilus]|uniref:Transcriptional regulator n=1 Tax=Ornithinibacillus halophilus TaxID=930117 RepID=A0A1M5JP04_9BACI|nr:DeoR family transcriptional regulator [Ornithinibacillus halophilus]SHG42261.1 transcriptional regulator [Ornithinibacillus halophilus]
MKRTPTRQKILTVLKKDHQLTIDELVDHFTISEVAIRRHIHELEKQGLIKKNTIKQKIGRPYYTYELTKEGHQTFPNQYEKLPVELLQDLEELHGEQAVADVLRRRMEREKKEFETRISTDDFDQKVKEVAEIQDEKGYMVEISKDEEGNYEMKNFNCPISNIASCYKQVCSNEKTVFSEIFRDSEVVTQTCITSGDSFCKWMIKKPNTGTNHSKD